MQHPWAPEMDNFYQAPMAASNSMHAIRHEIHVLLVDHEIALHNQTLSQLQAYQYKVTYAENAYAAMTLLTTPNPNPPKFDVVMASLNSDPHGLLLLQTMVGMCIPLIWMSEDDNATLAMRALESGAFLCIKKPVSSDFIINLWQVVVREKQQQMMMRERELLVASSNNLGPIRGVEFRELGHRRVENANPNPNPNPNSMMKNKGKYKRNRHNDYYDEDEYDSDHNRTSQHGNVRRKMCTEWTQELHAKFKDAIEKLGEGRCFPKEILEEMNEPGLTRMQVASHLQKCRNENWRSPEERKPTHQSTQISAPNSNRTHSKPRRFGSMPILSKPSTSQIHSGTQEMGHGPAATMANHLETNPRHGADEFFNFQDMDCLLHDFSGKPQEHEINNPTPTPTREGYHVDPSYNEDQNSGEKSMMKNKN